MFHVTKQSYRGDVRSPDDVGWSDEDDDGNYLDRHGDDDASGHNN